MIKISEYTENVQTGALVLLFIGAIIFGIYKFITATTIDDKWIVLFTIIGIEAVVVLVMFCEAIGQITRKQLKKFDLI